MIRVVKFFLDLVLIQTSIGRAIVHSRKSQNMITYKMFLLQKLFGFNKKCYWPVHFTSIVQMPENIYVGVDTAPGIMNSCYIQGYGGIKIGDYTQIGPSVGIISLNHNPLDVYEYQDEKFPSVKIGSYCWLGMHSVILPGVELGDFTIVGAGSIVTKSFPDGYCVLVGNPAKIVRKLDPDKCVRKILDNEYHGYIAADRMSEFRARKLKI